MKNVSTRLILTVVIVVLGLVFAPDIAANDDDPPDSRAEAPHQVTYDLHEEKLLRATQKREAPQIRATTTTTIPPPATTVEQPAPEPAPVAPPPPEGGNRALGHQMMLAAGYGEDQWGCLEKLWTHESGWNEHAHNGSSGAHGIPQSLPGSKMASHGADWATNPATQISWGLSYVQGRYGSPCGAYSWFQSHNWY